MSDLTDIAARTQRPVSVRLSALVRRLYVKHLVGAEGAQPVQVVVSRHQVAALDNRTRGVRVAQENLRAVLLHLKQNLVP